ncbi:MAG: hypothetical protein EAZ97_06775 [Bacteroidetes bacterium]|nr:MAG: hypothetical protein EAZ97_06775 [Bacteroidota bacterium]
MKNLFFALFLLCTFSVHAQITEYSFTGSVGNETFLNADYQPINGFITAITRSPALGITSSAGKFAANAFPTSGIDLAKYFSLTIRPNPTYFLDITQIKLDEDRSLTGIRNWAIRSSKDNFTTNLATFNVPDDDLQRNQTINLSGFTAFTTAVEFRIYGYTSESGTTGAWRIDNLKIFGSIYEYTPPSIVSVGGNPDNPKEVIVIFDENVQNPSAENPSFYQIKNIGNPNSVIRHSVDNKRVSLNFSNDFVSANTYFLTAYGIKDMFSNEMQTATKAFIYNDLAPPLLSQINTISNQSLDVLFNEKIDKISAETLANYQTNNAWTPVSAIQDENDPKLVHLFFADKFSSNTTFNLKISNIKDQSNNSVIGFLSANFVYDTQKPSIQSVTAISATQIQILFSENIDPISAQVFGNYVLSNSIFPINSFVSANKVLLTFSQNLIPNTIYPLKVSNIKDLLQNVITSTTKNVLFDPNPPALQKINIFSDQEIELIFNEELDKISGENIANYVLNNALNPISAVQNINDLKSIKLIFSSLGNSANTFLSASNIKDLAGNIANLQTISFNIFSPALSKVTVLSKNKLQIQFSRKMQMAAVQNIANYLVNNNLQNPVSVFAYDFANFTTTILTFANNFEIKQANSLTINNLTDQSNRFLTAQSENFTYIPRVQSLKLVSQNLIDVIFESEVENITASQTSRYNISNIGFPILALQDDDQKIVHLQFAKNIPKNVLQFLTVGIGSINLQNGIIAPQSEHSFIFDSQAPTILNVSLLSNFEILLQFSENISENTAEALNFYLLNGTETPISASLNTSNPTLLTLKFANKFQVNINYSLIIKNIQDLEGNTNFSQTISFRRPAVPNFKQLLFTEIFADPTPKVNLPESEFIEIYNNSTQVFDLQGLKISDGNTESILPRYLFQPDSYLVLCPSSAVSDFAKYGNVIGLSNWVSLTNSGKTLNFLDSDDKLIDKITYSDDWYKNEVKKGGGWTLELINLKAQCMDSENWTASENANGGTPAQQNSVFNNNPDKTAPQLLSINTDNQGFININFTENTDSLSLNNLNNYKIEGLPIKSAKAINPKSVALELFGNLPEGKVYKLIINGIRDCAGNSTADTLTFGIGKKANFNDIWITEIMADEEPSRGLPLAEYLEIYNASNQVLSLGNLILSDATSSAKLPNVLISPKEYLILTSITKAILFKNIRVVDVPSFPTLNNSGELLTLADSTGKQVFSVNYSDSWYGSEIKKQGGWSLEMTQSKDFCKNSFFWTASVNEKGGTPAQENSVKFIDFNFQKPEIKSVSVKNNQQINLIFSVNMDTLNLKNLANYQVSNAQIKNIQIVSATEINLFFQNAIQNISLKISGLSDCFGNVINVFEQEIILGRSPKANDLIISEIMADESPSTGLPLAEYIEIYNRSNDFLSLENLLLSNNRSNIKLPNVIISPKNYLLLCGSKADSFRLNQEISEKVLQIPNFFSLLNSGDLLKISNLANNEVVFSVNYSDSWYKDNRKKQGGWSLEMIDLDNLCSETENWTASMGIKGGTPAQQNSVFDINADKINPQISKLNVISEKEGLLEIVFSKNMDTLSLKNLANFKITQNIVIQAVTIIDSKTIRLKTSAIQAFTLYEFETQNLQDCASNSLINNKLYFGKGNIPQKNQLIITEIMADPSPKIGLPEREFLELYNKSENTINLSEIKLVDESGEVFLPDFNLKSKEFVLICANSALADFEKILPKNAVLAVPNFPSLDNRGEKLVLKNCLNETLFSVNYDVNWHSEGKKEGGWSLEMKDFEKSCVEKNNWISSENKLGGSPAKSNSVESQIQSFAPEVISFKTLNDSTLQIIFDQNIDSLALAKGNYKVSDAKIKYLIINGLTEILFITEKLSSRNIYEIFVTEVSNCLGQKNVAFQQNFGIGRTPQKHELLISEIMADPSPTVSLPESEYIELYNPTNDILQLKNCQLSVNQEFITLPSQTIFPKEYVLLVPKSALADFENRFPKAKILALSTWKTIANNGDRLMLRNEKNMYVFGVNFTKNWYKDSEKSDGGWSLEMKDLQNPCAESANWESSLHKSGGTPSFKNSFDSKIGDQKPANLLKIEVRDSLNLQVFFDDRLDSLSIIQAKWALNEGIKIKKVVFSYEKDREISLFLENPLKIRTQYELQIKDFADCAGNLQVNTQTKTFFKAEKGGVQDVILNEILFNPLVGGIDFVEIFNNSDKYIDLKGWKLANVEENKIANLTEISDEQQIVQPFGYRILTENKTLLKSQYLNMIDSNALEMKNLPTFNDKNGSVILMDLEGQTDRFDYDEKLHFPLLDNKNGVSLERISSQKATNDLANWHSAASPFYASAGFLNSQNTDFQVVAQDCISQTNQVFTPDGDGFQDFTLLNFHCVANGTLANVMIFDAVGRKITDLLQNALVGTDFLLQWNGTNSDGEKVRTGYYIFYIELFDLKGNVSKIQKKTVVGARF